MARGLGRRSDRWRRSSRHVQLGDALPGGLVEVEGLTPSDKLIVGGREGLEDGDRIRVSGEDETRIRVLNHRKSESEMPLVEVTALTKTYRKGDHEISPLKRCRSGRRARASSSR